MIRSLLVGYDGSHGARIALQHAVDLASRCEGRICLLTGTVGAELDVELLDDDSSDLATLAEGGTENDEAELPWTADADGILAEALDLCRELTVRCVARPAVGGLSAALIGASQLSDMIFIARDALAGTSTYVGAARTARRVASDAACPVVITPRQYEPIRSAIVVCPMNEVGARALHTAAELTSILQVKMEVLIVSADLPSAGRWVRDVKRYVVDHGLTANVLLRKPPVGQQLDSLSSDRQSPLLVVPRGDRISALLHRDPLSEALKALGATVVVQP